jgi:hypothetical protein
MRRMMASCWKPLSEDRHCGWARWKSLQTTEATRRKRPGRLAPHSGAASSPTSTVVW